MPISSISAKPHQFFTTSNKFLFSFQSRVISSNPPSPPPPPSSPVPTHDQISYLILDQKSPSQALQTFRWASKLPNFTHTRSTYRALIHKLCTFRHFDTVHNLLDEMPSSIGSPPDDAIFVVIVRGLGSAQKIREAIGVLDLVAEFGGVPSLKLYNSILDVLVKYDIDIAREFYRRKMMGCGVKGDDYTFGTLMKGLCLTNRIGDGFKLLQVMKKGGLCPNTVIYNTLLHALCKNGKVGRARCLMNEILEPNDVTYNLMISAYCKEENLVQAQVLLEKSFSAGFMPNIVSVTKVLELMCDAGRVNEAAEVLERVESSGVRVDVVAYNTLIRGFCRLGKAKVGVHFLKQMERRGCLPTVDTYNLLISGFCEISMLDVALDLFNVMKTDGIRWNFLTYDTLIRGFCSQGRVAEAFNILELMEESKGGSKCLISPYNSIIYGLHREGRTEEAVKFLQKMGNLFPRAVDRSLRIIGFCEEGEIKDAKKVYDQMIKEGGIPSVLVYYNLIYALCKHGCIKEALELVNEMIDLSYVPVSDIYNAIVSGFCSQGKVTSAIKLVEDTVERGFQPDAATYSHLIDALCRSGDLQRAIRIIQQMIGKGIAPDYWAWNSLVLCYFQQSQLLDQMHISNVNNQLQVIIQTQ